MAEENMPLLEQTEHDPHEDDGTEVQVADIPETSVTNVSEIVNNATTNPDPVATKAIDVSKKDKTAMKTIKEVLQQKNISTDINILVIGRTGQGKSALVNSLIELKKFVKEGAKSSACTTTSQSYTYPNIIPGVNVTIIDSPGLQDIQDKEHKHIQEMKNECNEISLALYCMKLTDRRFTNDDKRAMQKLHQAFGQKFWERVIFVLTFANREPLDMWDERDADDENEEPEKEDDWVELKKKRLAGRVQLRKEEINTMVNELLQLHEPTQKIRFEVFPAGYHNPIYNGVLCGVNWHQELITSCCNTAKQKQKLKLNKKIALAIIIDNRGEVKVENEERVLNDEAALLKKAFEDLEFAALYFNSLSSESIATLFEAISKVDHSKLLIIALVFLSKGKTAELYDADGMAVPYAAVFDHFQRCPTPVIFFFDSANGNIQKKKNSKANDTPNASDDDVESENDSTDDDIRNENNDHHVENESTISDTQVNDSAIDDIHVQNENDSVIDDTCVQNENDSAAINDIHLQNENGIADNMHARNENNSTVGDTQNEKYFKLPLHICPQNSLVLAARHNSESSPVVKEFTEKLSDTSVQECFRAICANNNSTTVKSIWHKKAGNSLFIMKSINDSADNLEQKLELYHSIWYNIRCNTIDKIEENKEEIVSIIRKARVARLAITVSGMVGSGGLLITGIALVPVTFGGSLAISALGGVVGAAAAAGNAVAIFVTKFLNNKKLKKAQQHIKLDQQISLMIDKEAIKYNQMMTSALSHAPESSAYGLQGAAAIGRSVGAGIAIGAEGAVETAALAVRTTGRAAGIALAGVSLAVTIPIDIGLIVYHSINIHKSKNDPTGKTESNQEVKIIYNQLETLLKGMCHAIDEFQYEVKTERNIVRDESCGYEICVPVKEEENLTVTVYTLVSGPFVYPDGYTLVSAVYDITMPELPQPATIKLEHCVDESDQTRPDLCFAVGSIDLKGKKIIFEKVDQEYGSIEQKNSCLLCILYKRTLQEITSVTYAAQCYYVKKYKNFWTLNIVFTKFLSANYKLVQNTCGSDIECSCHSFTFTTDKLDLTCFKNTTGIPGWIISPKDSEEMPDTISMQDIDSAVLREGSAKVLKKAFPFITLNVYIFDDEIAANKIDQRFEIGGTNLIINIKRDKE